MLRHLLQGSGSAQQASNIMKVPSGAWQGAWRRLYTTTQRSIVRRSPINSGASRRSATPLHPLQPIGLRAAAPGWAPASRRGFRFSAWRRSTTDGEKAKPLSLSQRLKKLFKDYGKSAIGVYLALSVLDFPFCFLLVRIVGTDTIGMFQHAKSAEQIRLGRLRTSLLIQPFLARLQARLSTQSCPLSPNSFPTRSDKSGAITGNLSRRRNPIPLATGMLAKRWR